MALTLASFKIQALIAGRFSLDGGVAFGVAPRVLWEKHFVPDALGRVGLVARVLLLQRGDRCLLVDAGPGQCWDAKPRSLYAIDPEPSLEIALATVGVSPDQVTDVIVSHLHWDHVGGLIRDTAKGPQLSFPDATHHLQRRNWKWAHSPAEYDRRAYRPEVLDLLERSGRLHFVEGETELLEGLTLLPCEGHTVGQQLVRVEGPEGGLVYCGDAIPTAAHLAAGWGLAYDLYPLSVIEEKKQLLAEALEENWTLAFAHDPHCAACQIEEIDGRIQVAREIEL